MHADIRPGVYWNAVGIFKVCEGKESGNLYAKQLNVKARTWSYAKGAIHKLQPQTRVTLELAKAFGLANGVCMICGRELTNPESVRSGVGPVCAKMF